ncbi:MAG: hypothetical protein GXX85_08230 [Ignavibacteria bacterium]|nr:hypothetical protein [Ignavibacteria bacterium]
MTEKDFIHNWVFDLRNGNLKKFPEDFVNSDNCYEIDLPAKTLVLGSELFGSYELVDMKGEKVFQAEDIFQAKYILYSNRTMPSKLMIPVGKKDLERTVKQYEKYLDGLLGEIIKSFRNEFPEKKNFFEAANTIFNSLFLHRY